MKAHQSTFYFGGLDSLKTAIVYQAVLDYTEELKTIASFTGNSPNCLDRKKELFFRARGKASFNVEKYPEETYMARLNASAEKILQTYYQDALFLKESNERFFHSEWYEWLTDIDPEAIIKEVNDKIEKWRNE